MKILILTDHSTHQSTNSVYSIARAIRSQSHISEVWVASRGDEKNTPFFYEHAGADIFGIPVNDSYIFENASNLTLHSELILLSHFDFILLRLPRPVLVSFFYYITSRFPEKRIVNRPSGIIKTSNKAYIRRFKKYIPPSKLVNSWKSIKELAERFPIVLKPLENYGGRGIIKIENGEVSIEDKKVITLEEFKSAYHINRQPYLAMKYLENVKYGDKRIVVADGKVLSTSLRLPKEGSWLCNVAQGGSSMPSSPNEEEWGIIHHINPVLKKEGIFLYGLDTLLNDNGKRLISEINTLSVGGIYPADLDSKMEVSKLLAEQFILYCADLLKEEKSI